MGFDLDIAMLCVAVHGSKLFTTLHCRNYFNVIITVRTKDDTRIWSFEMSDFTKRSHLVVLQNAAQYNILPY